jgi:predicted tellurium resistance membrane protein TerC
MSSFLTKLMDCYRILPYVGAAILGKVGGEMIITDPFVLAVLKPDMFDKYGVIIIFTVFVVTTGRMMVISRRKRPAALTR